MARLSSCPILGARWEPILVPVTAPNPAATARWLARPHIRGLLEDLVTGRFPLTHQALAARPGPAATYLRDLLASCGALPPADRQLTGYEGWVHSRLTTLQGHPHQRLLRQFSLWHQLPRMRTRAATRPLRPTAANTPSSDSSKPKTFWPGPPEPAAIPPPLPRPTSTPAQVYPAG
jgi:hypothetical protein